MTALLLAVSALAPRPLAAPECVSRRATLVIGAAALSCPMASANAESSSDGSWAAHTGAFDSAFFESFSASNDAARAAGYLYKLVEKPSQGERPVQGQKVYVHYTGYLLDGTKFDSSYDRGKPFGFLVGKGKVIQGWEGILVSMVPGMKVVARIPPEYAYGAKGRGPIPANAPLVFYMELVEMGNVPLAQLGGQVITLPGN